MSKLRANLKMLMEKAGHNAYYIADKTGIPASTTYRFLRGVQDDPRSDTVKKWAMVYNLTESQLRGDMPIDGIETPKENDLSELLTLEELKLVNNVKSMGDEAKSVLYRLAEMLAESRSISLADSSDRRHGERRQRNSFPNPQSRATDIRYKSPPRQRHVSDGRHINGKSQTA